MCVPPDRENHGDPGVLLAEPPSGSPEVPRDEESAGPGQAGTPGEGLCMCVKEGIRNKQNNEENENSVYFFSMTSKWIMFYCDNSFLVF